MQNPHTVGVRPQDTAAIDYEAIVSEIRAEMARRRLSGQQLATMSGLTQSTVSRRLNGSPFTLPEVLAICAALGVSLRELLADANAKRPQLVARGAVVAGAGFEPATSGLRACLGHGGHREPAPWSRARAPQYSFGKQAASKPPTSRKVIPFPRSVSNLGLAS